MKTILTVKLTLLDDDMDRLEKRAKSINRWSLNLLEDVIQDATINELGIISKAEVTKIE